MRAWGVSTVSRALRTETGAWDVGPDAGVQIAPNRSSPTGSYMYRSVPPQPRPQEARVVLDDADGSPARAKAMWEEAGLPESGTVTVEQLQQARAALRD